MRLKVLIMAIIAVIGVFLFLYVKSKKQDLEVAKLIATEYPAEYYQNMVLTDPTRTERMILNFDQIERHFGLNDIERGALLRRKADFYKHIDLERAFKYALKSEDILKDVEDSEEKYKTAICLAKLYSYCKNYQSSYIYIDKALEVAQLGHNSVLMRNAYALRISNLIDEENYKEAIAEQLRSIIYFKHSIDYAYNNIALSYFKLKDYQNAKIYYHKILNRKGNSETTREVAHSNLAKCYFAENKTDSAVYHYEYYFAMPHNKNSKITYNQLSSLTDYSKLLWEKGSHDKAIQTLRAVLSYHYKTGVEQKDYIDALSQLISFYSMANYGNRALELFYEYNKVNQLIQDEQNNANRLYMSRTFKIKELSTELETKQLFRSQILALMEVLFIILITVIILLFGYKYFKRKESLLIAKQIPSPQKSAVLQVSQPDYNDSLSSNMELYRQIEQFMIKEKPFINNRYSLEELSRDIYSNRSYISAAINTGYGNNFNQWLNKHRIDHLLQQINDGIQKNKLVDLNELAYSSGFASQTSFYRAFKSITNMTPTQYYDLYVTRQTGETEQTALTKQPEQTEYN